jgi:hypothetical protein
VKSVTFVNAAGGWRPRTWLGAPAPGGLALPSAQPTASWLYAPRGVYLGPRSGQAGPPGPDVLVVADAGNHRVLGWTARPDWRSRIPPTTGSCSGTGPTRGRPPCSASPASGRTGRTTAGVTRDSLCWPYGLSLSAGRLAIADSGNNRVVIWERE